MSTLLQDHPAFDPGETVELAFDGLRRRVQWGHPWQFDTAAYWVDQTKLFVPKDNYRLGSTLAEEVVACLLGGFGLSALVAVRAFEAVRESRILEAGTISAAELEAVLQRPLQVGGRSVRYRFPRQRADRIARSMQALSQSEPPTDTDGVSLRDWLLQLPGVGRKTASWIARNHTGTDAVAIIDIHVLRAGRRAGVFAEEWDPTHHYSLCEGFFLSWAAAGGVRASVMDACIWSQLSTNGSISRQDENLLA